MRVCGLLSTVAMQASLSLIRKQSRTFETVLQRALGLQETFVYRFIVHRLGIFRSLSILAAHYKPVILGRK